jgi:hypothetical protein
LHDPLLIDSSNCVYFNIIQFLMQTQGVFIRKAPSQPLEPPCHR